MYIIEIANKIEATDKKVIKAAQTRFDSLIKPVGSLAKLEEMTTRYAAIKGSAAKKSVKLPKKRTILVFGDIASSSHIEATLQKKNSIAVLGKEVNADVHPILILDSSVEDNLEEGAILAQEYITKNKYDIMLLGAFIKAPEFKTWKKLLNEKEPVKFLETLNSPVITAMTGAILEAGSLKIPIIIDGVATALALVAATKFNSAVIDYAFAGHQSLEDGMLELLEKLELSVSLQLEIDNGIGIGAATCLTLFDAGIKAYTEMETFEEAGVHKEMDEFALSKQKQKG